MNKPLPLLELNGSTSLAAPGPDTEFDWDTDESVIIPPRLGVAIYENSLGQIVLRQQSASGDVDEDPFLHVSREHAQKIIDALKPYAVRS